MSNNSKNSKRGKVIGFRPLESEESELVAAGMDLSALARECWDRTWRIVAKEMMEEQEAARKKLLKGSLGKQENLRTG